MAFAAHHLVTVSEPESAELFEFRRDPFELRDLLVERPLVADELEAIGERWRKEVENRDRPKIAPRPLDEKTLEDLKALGYIQ